MSKDSAATATIADPSAWISDERQDIKNFVAVRAEASSNLSTHIATFEAELQSMLAEEAAFSASINDVAGSIDQAGIDALLGTLKATDASIDASFKELNSIILANNAAAAEVSVQVNAAADTVSEITAAQGALDAKITGYIAAISSFRDHAFQQE